MRVLLTALLVTAAWVPCACAQDQVEDFLYQPSISGGRVSMPAPEETARKEALAAKPTEAAPVVVEETKVPEPIAQEFKAPAPTVKPQVVSSEPTPLMDDAQAPAPEAVEADLSQTSLLEVLAKSYGSSPTLRAEREKLRIQYEEVAQADALGRPLIDVDGGVGYTHSKDDPGSSDNFVTKDAGITLVQPVWTGGRISSYIQQQEKLSDAQIAAYESVAQQVFLNVVTAAMDIVRDRAVIELNEKNRELIAEQLKASKNGFEVGALTRTDVAQAQARFSEAEANVTAAHAAYQSSLARYKQYAGMDGESADFVHDTSNLSLPGDLSAAQTKAEQDNPEILYARRLEKAAEEAVEVAEGERTPDLNLVASAGHDWHTVAAVDESENASIGLRVGMNLYEGGAMQSRIRQAKIARYERANRVEEAQRSVTQQVTTAWNNQQAALVRINALDEQVEAATIARNGVYKEREVGTRTVLDTLDAERELLNAQVGLVQAKRDAVVADYGLLAATGQLTPSHLGMMAPEAEHGIMESVRGPFENSKTEPRS
ncbi:MAG TPA: TolC family outer membrane protein [Alphaproteobacteria bacterium]